MVALIIGILIASLVVGDGDSGAEGGENAKDAFPAVRAWGSTWRSSVPRTWLAAV